MKNIEIITGVRFKPEYFINRISKSKKLQGVNCSHINTIYSPCWVFELRVILHATKKTNRYAGYYGGLEETSMSPGKLRIIPSTEERDIEDFNILADKVTEEEAVKLVWNYNKNWISIKFKNLNEPPELEQYRLHKCYKAIYVMEFYNTILDEKKYKVLDSLTGDLEDIVIS